MLGNAQAPGFPIVYCSDGFCELTGYPRAQVSFYQIVFCNSCCSYFLLHVDFRTSEPRRKAGCVKLCTTSFGLSYTRWTLDNKKAQLTLANPRDAKACRKLRQFEVKTSCRQVNDLFEVIRAGFSVNRGPVQKKMWGPCSRNRPSSPPSLSRNEVL